MNLPPTNKKKVKIGDYIVKKEIGNGKYSKVYLAIHEPTKQKVAIKAIDKSKINSDEKDKSSVMKKYQFSKKFIIIIL